MIWFKNRSNIQNYMQIFFEIHFQCMVHMVCHVPIVTMWTVCGACIKAHSWCKAHAVQMTFGQKINKFTNWRHISWRMNWMSVFKRDDIHFTSETLLKLNDNVQILNNLDCIHIAITFHLTLRKVSDGRFSFSQCTKTKYRVIEQWKNVIQCEYYDKMEFSISFSSPLRKIIKCVSPFNWLMDLKIHSSVFIITMIHSLNLIITILKLHSITEQ